MAAHINFNKMPQEERRSISLSIVNSICDFLQLFMSPIIARRIVSALLIIAGMRSNEITPLTGMCERSIRELKKQLASGDTDCLFEIRNGRGRKSKFKDIESMIIDEVEKGNYQTLQQIADMVYDKYGIKVSIMAISRLLKKRAPQAEGWFATG